MYRIVLFGLLVTFYVATQSSQAAIVSGVHIDNSGASLTKLMDMIKLERGRPSGQDVIDAYNEYVNLHKLQNELAEGFGDQQGEKKGADEQRYSEVSGLLRRPELQLITQNLFNLLQVDYTLNEISSSPKLKTKLDAAIKSLFV